MCDHWLSELQAEVEALQARVAALEQANQELREALELATNYARQDELLAEAFYRVSPSGKRAERTGG